VGYRRRGASRVGIDGLDDVSEGGRIDEVAIWDNDEREGVPARGEVGPYAEGVSVFGKRG
jgi:hypothetical protein